MRKTRTVTKRITRRPPEAPGMITTDDRPRPVRMVLSGVLSLMGLVITIIGDRPGIHAAGVVLMIAGVGLYFRARQESNTSSSDSDHTS